jgi:hypothetical protein
MGRFTTTTSGVGGAFTLRGLPSGSYAIFASLLEPVSDRSSRRNVSGGTTVRVTDGDVRANIQVNVHADVSGRISIEKSTGQSVSGILISLVRPQNDLTNDSFRSSFNSQTEQKGNFRFTDMPSGNYDFAIRSRYDIYLKQALCSGKDYTLRTLTIEGGASVNDCVLTLGTDASVIKGLVVDGDKPVPGRVVVAIPEDRSLRHLERFTVIGTTNANGEYQLSGIIPGDYLLFAVPPDDAETYFDINFADRNQRDAERVTVKSGDTKIVPLKPTTPQ